MQWSFLPSFQVSKCIDIPCIFTTNDKIIRGSDVLSHVLKFHLTAQHVTSYDRRNDWIVAKLQKNNSQLSTIHWWPKKNHANISCVTRWQSLSFSLFLIFIQGNEALLKLAYFVLGLAIYGANLHQVFKMLFSFIFPKK